MDAPKGKRGRPKREVPPAKTAEARESQLISMAVDLAAKQLDEGTASSQVITHFLKLGSIRAKLEMEKIRQENRLLEAKTEALASVKRVEELYANALAAMTVYQGRQEDSEDVDD